MTLPTERTNWTLDASEDSFQREAVERSRELPVVVDFWAAWCQPCRMLGPILEKLAAEYGGKFLLVKADVDKLPNIAAGFGVQSIPAVYALRDGAIVDYFVGVLSEAQSRAWIDRLLPSAAETLVAAARKLETTDPQAAEAKYREAIATDPDLAAAKIALAGLLATRGRADDAHAILEELEARGHLEPEAERVKAQLHLAGGAQAPADLDALRAAVAAGPKDLAARLKLAEGLAAGKLYEEALQTALVIVETHGKPFAESAKTLMVDIFRLLPDDSELTTTYRRRLSTALY